jgi:hypothetical protein
MLIDKRAHFVRSVSSSVAKNTPAAFRISFAQLEVLTLELRDLLPLRAGRQIRSQATFSLRWADPLALNQLLGYFLGRGIARGSPDPRTDRPRFKASAKQ